MIPDRQTGSLPGEPRVFATLRKLRGPVGLIVPDVYNVSWEAKILHKASPTARALFTRAEVAGFSQSTLLDGSKEGGSVVGNLSYFAYQAAAFEALSGSKESPEISFLAGLGVGLPVALYASGAISFETGLGLIYGASLNDQRPFSERLRYAYSVGLRGNPPELGDGISDPKTPIVSSRNGEVLTTATQIRAELEALTREKGSVRTVRKAMKEAGINSPFEVSSRGLLTKLRENKTYAALGAAALVGVGGVVLTLAYRSVRRPKSEKP